MHVGFHFLIERKTSQKVFRYEAIQLQSNTENIVGGEEYVINVKGRTKFEAEAGDDQEVNPNQTVYLQAEQLAEMAVYRWYDMDNNLITEGKNLTVSPDITKKYKLEVITTADGFKDYDTVEVKVKNFVITDVYPNPASSILNIEYKATKATSAYLMITKHDGSFSNQYMLSPTQTQKQITLSN